MRLGFHGHACFELQAEEWPTVVIDPYRPDGLGGRFSLPPIEASPDIVAITHFHEDHAWIPAPWKDVPVVDSSGSLEGVRFTTEMVYHDKAKGTRMGLTVSMAIEYAGLKIVHLGDIGSPPKGAVSDMLMNADVLLLPVGDTYTLGPEEGVETALSLNPGWVVPMHGAHPRIDLPLRPTSEFVDLWQGAVHPLKEKQHWFTLDGRPEVPTVLHLSAPGS